MNISAQNTFTASKLIRPADNFDLLVSGTFVGTVTLQVSHNATTWYDVKEYTAASFETGDLGSTWYVRAGIKTGAYTSGTAIVEVV